MHDTVHTFTTTWISAPNTPQFESNLKEHLANPCAVVRTAHNGTTINSVSDLQLFHPSTMPYQCHQGTQPASYPVLAPPGKLQQQPVAVPCDVCCHREKNRLEAVSSAVIAASSTRRLGVNMANQMKKRVHAAKERAADKTILIVHPNVRDYCWFD